MRPRRGIVCVALLGTVLAGCSSDSDPEAEPSETPTAGETTSSSSPTPTESESPAPSMPAKARQTTDAGAAAFVRYYVRLVNHAAATGDVDELRSVAGQCNDCMTIANQIASTYTNGGSYAPSPIWRLRDVQVVANSTDVLVSLREPKVVRVPEKGAEGVESPGGKFTVRFKLSSQDGHWTVVRAERI